MEQQTYGQQLLQGTNHPQLKTIKESLVEVIDKLHEHKQQTTTPRIKQAFSKAILGIENGFNYAHKALTSLAFENETSNMSSSSKSSSRRQEAVN